MCNHRVISRTLISELTIDKVNSNPIYNCSTWAHRALRERYCVHIVECRGLERDRTWVNFLSAPASGLCISQPLTWQRQPPVMSPCWSSQASGHNIRLRLIRGARKREFGESIKKALQGVLWWWWAFYRDERMMMDYQGTEISRLMGVFLTYMKVQYEWANTFHPSSIL